MLAFPSQLWLQDLSRRSRHRPVGISELPSPVSEFRQAAEETVLVYLLTFSVDTDLRIRARHDGQVWRQRINTQIIPPAKVDVLDRACELLNRLRGGLTVRKDEAALCRHEKGRAVSEIFAPSARPLLCDVVSHVRNKTSHTVFDGYFARRRQRFRIGVAPFVLFLIYQSPADFNFNRFWILLIHPQDGTFLFSRGGR